MNNKSTTKKIIDFLKKKIYKIIKKENRLSKKNFQDKPLKQFIKKTNNINVDDKIIISSLDFKFLCIIICLIIAVLIVYGYKRIIEPFVAIPTAIILMIVFIMMLKDAKEFKK